MANPEHPRLIIYKFLSLEVCKELGFIHKSCGTVGYRRNVFSTTLSHLIATNCAHLIMPFVPLREKLKEKVEEFFGCEFELFVEFTGLISWSRGASIGWHSDDDRPYLKQRDYSAVCYLNSYGEDFKGGLFHFKDWEPATIVPMAGDVVMYTADSRNVHSVDEIMEGERLTLTLWFSRDRSHDEDAKLISLLSQGQLCHSVQEHYSFLPRPASSQMYWFPPDQASTPLNSSDDSSEILTEPLRLTRQDELFSGKFVNILHALQVIQFYCWKASELQSSEQEKTLGIEPLSAPQREVVNMLKHMFLKDEQLADTHFSFRQDRFDWASFSAAVTAWEAYCGRLGKEMLVSIPYWRTHQSIFSFPLLGLEEVAEN